MDHHQHEGLSAEELAAEEGVALPDKEVVSILDLNADLDLAIDAAAPIDLGVAANANVAAPIDASASANLLSEGSTSQVTSTCASITWPPSSDMIVPSTSSRCAETDGAAEVVGVAAGAAEALGSAEAVVAPLGVAEGPVPGLTGAGWQAANTTSAAARVGGRRRTLDMGSPF